MKKNKPLIIVFLILLGLAGLSFKLHQPKKFRQLDRTPLVLVPGTNADVDRFDALIQQLAKITASQDILKITVQKNGKMLVKGKLKKNSARSFIVIGFQDNSEKAVDKQGEWIDQALTLAKKSYPFKSFFAVGHSNEGLALTAFLEDTKGNQQNKKGLKKLMMVGTLFNDTKLSQNKGGQKKLASKAYTPLLKRMIAAKDQIPQNLEVAVLAGQQKESKSDGVVPVQSVLSASAIYQEGVISYTQIVIKGNQTQHSELPTNRKVMNEILQFMYHPAS